MDQPTFTLPPDILDEIQQIIDEENRPLGELVNEALAEWIEKRLWGVVNQGLPLSEEVRLHELLKKTTLSDAERGEVHALADMILDQTVEQSRALGSLQKRGYDISSFLGLKDDVQKLARDAALRLSDEMLARYSDDELWAIFHHFIAIPEQHRLHELRIQREIRSLTSVEREEQENLLGVLNRYMLVRSIALAMLNQRGYETAHLLQV
jgi:hypothetical protein